MADTRLLRFAMKTCIMKNVGLGPVVQSTISANLGLPVNLLLWFRLLRLNNLVQISQLETFSYIPNIC